MAKYLDRLENIVGEEAINKLKDKRVMICGVGGVGSFVAEALARSGIGHLTLVDDDVIVESNLNRQLMTRKDNIGKSKVEELKKHLEEVSDCKIDIKNEHIDENFKIDEKYDYVADCIDSLLSKFHLAKICHELKIPIITSLGTAKRIDPSNIKVTKLQNTQNDPLAKAYRNLVKKKNYHEDIEVVFSDSAPLKNKCGDNSVLGSSIFVPGSVGLKIASVIFERLIKEEKENEV